MVEATPGVVTAIVVLTLGSIFLVLYLWKKYKELDAIWQNQSKWPPMYNRCPDYWEDKGTSIDGKTTSCVNTHGLGTTKEYSERGKTVNFANPNNKDTNVTELCNTINRNGLSWEALCSQ